jgi:predicted nucleic acid-binding protein
MTVLADTGFVLAMSISRDKWSQACREIYQHEPVILLPESSLAEIAYMLSKAGGSRGLIDFLYALPESRFDLVGLEQQDIRRATKLLDTYQNLPLDFVDAAIIALAERMNITRILTVDRRDFSIVRPRHIEHFELLP